MFKLMVATAVAACAVIVAPLGAAAPTNAKNAFPVTIFCPSGTFEAVVNGNGEFTAAHAVDSNTVLIPIAFGTFTVTFTDANGVTTTETDPPVTKGKATPKNGKVQNCTYSVEFSFPDGSSFAGSGSVTGFIPGK